MRCSEVASEAHAQRVRPPPALHALSCLTSRELRDATSLVYNMQLLNGLAMHVFAVLHCLSSLRDSIVRRRVLLFSFAEHKSLTGTVI